VLAALLPTAQAAGDAGDVPAPRPAHEVIVRGRGTLERALISACGPAWEQGARYRGVTLIVDPAQSLANAEESLVEALVALESRSPRALRWSLATLGRAPEVRRSSPSELGPALTGALEPRELIVDTITSLRDTAAACPDDSLLVYVATESFEDERDVEGLVLALHARGQTLSVVGPEAGFLRAWNDGFFPPYRGRRNADGTSTLYDTRVGRSPLAEEADATEPPWHGPETAVPLAPARFGDHFDGRLFTHRDEVDPETGEPVRRTYSHAYPSGWGPWSLMRLAAVTGGRYVTWSTRPSGEAVRYDGSRLDLHAPDLRARVDVLAAAAKRPLRAALVRVWGETTDATSAVFGSTPPVRSDLKSPIRMGEPTSRLRPPRLLYEREDHARFLDQCPKLIRLLDGAIRRIDAAIARASRPRDDAARRDLADARLLRHVLLCERFAWGEALSRGRRLMPRPWRDDGMVPKIDWVTWVRSVGGRERIDEVQLVDEKRAAALLADRRFLLETYAGTPWGEMVRRNRISTYELKRVRLARGNPAPRTGLADSEPRPPDVTPSGGTPGPATGD
jgi:hypothetical protein